MVHTKGEDVPRTTYVELCNVNTTGKNLDTQTKLSAKPERPKEVPLPNRKKIKLLKNCAHSLSVDADYIRGASAGKQRPKSPLFRQHSQNDPTITPRNIHFVVDDDLPSGTCLSCVFHSMPGLLKGGIEYLPSCTSIVPVIHDACYNRHYVDERGFQYPKGRGFNRGSSIEDTEDFLIRSQPSSYGNYLTVPTSPCSRSTSHSSDEGIVHDVQQSFEEKQKASPEHIRNSEQKEDIEWQGNYYNTHSSSQYESFYGGSDRMYSLDSRSNLEACAGKREEFSKRGKSISDVGTRRVLKRQPSTRSEGRIRRVLPEIPRDASSFLRLHWRKPEEWQEENESRDTHHYNTDRVEQISLDEEYLQRDADNREVKQRTVHQDSQAQSRLGQSRAHVSLDADRAQTTSFTKRNKLSERSKTMDNANKKTDFKPKQEFRDKHEIDSQASSSSSANVKNTSQSSKKIITKKMNNEISDPDDNAIVQLPPAIPTAPHVTVTDSNTEVSKNIGGKQYSEDTNPEDPQKCLAKRLMEVGPADPQRVQVIVQDVLYEMGAERILQYKEAFGKFDKDCIGTISSKQLRRLLRTLGHNPRDDELRELINQVDMDENGKIDFNEFIIMIGYFDKANNTSEDLSNIFRVYDGGSINVDELRDVCSKYLTESVPIDKINEMIDFVDRDGDGEIERDELCRVWSNRW